MKTPKYLQLFYDMQENILSGNWYNGMLIPTEPELCLRYSVSRVTVRRTMEELQNVGLIVRIQGKGTFVTGGNTKKSLPTSREGLMDNLLANGLSVHSIILEKSIVQVDKLIKDALHLPLNHDSTVWLFRRLRFVTNHPVVITNAYVPLKVGDKMIHRDLEDTSFFRIYSDITGQRIGNTYGFISALIPTPEECDLLEQPHNSAHLLHKSTTFLENGTPVEYAVSIYNTKYYKFSVDMTNLLPIRCLVKE